MELKEKDLAVSFAKIIEIKKGENIVVLNVKKLTFITDFFIIGSCKNQKHIKTITDELTSFCNMNGINILNISGYNDEIWTVIDIGFAVIHLFQEDKREFYNLEELWFEATKVRWKYYFNRYLAKKFHNYYVSSPVKSYIEK